MNETLTFQDVMDTLYILYRDRSIRIYGIGALPNVDFSVEDSSVFRDSYNIYLPKDEYTVGTVRKIVEVMNEKFGISS